MSTIYEMDSIEKKRIFDVALTLMEEIGYDNLSIRKICEEADISIGKFYRYFQSKQEILAFFYKQLESNFRDSFDAQFKALDIKEQLIEFYVWFNGYISSFGIDFVKNFFNNQNPLLNTHVYNNEIINITDELLINAIQNGYKLPEGTTVRDISYDICVIVKGIIFDWCIRRGEFDIKQYSKELLGKCIEGILFD